MWVDIELDDLIVVQKARGERHGAHGSHRLSCMTVNDVDALPLVSQRQRHLLLDDLDPDQYEAVTTTADVVVVRAGAGSGKTTVLTRRIAWRVDTESANARHVLAITFTRQAAGELRRRLRQLAGETERESHLVTAGTFHAVALSLLRQRREDQGKQMPNVLNNRYALLSAARGTERPGDESYDILNMIDWAHARLLSPADVVKRLSASEWRLNITINSFADIFHAYETMKRKRGVLDMNDMISLVVKEAREQPQFADSIRWQFRHVHVDEAQDMNPLQYAFLQLLLGDRPDVFLVGDPNQAIYGFNGADNSLFDELPGIDTPATIINLPSNYRCSPQIVTGAVHVLANGSQHADAVSRRHDGRAIELIRCQDDDDELRQLTSHIKNLASDGFTWNSIAVLARTNQLATNIARALTANDIPLKESRLGQAEQAALSEASALGSRHAMTAWSSDILDQETLDEDDELIVQQSVREVALKVREYLDENRHGVVDGRSFASWFSGAGREDESTGVEVLTFHAAKGREWPAVLLAGVEPGLLPHSSARTDEAKREEARLAYVACTRAADRLLITWADTRGGNRAGPSPLIRGIPTGEWSPAPPPDSVRERNTKRRQTKDPRKTAVMTWRAHAARVAGLPEQSLITDSEIERILATQTIDEVSIMTVVGELRGRRLAPRIIAALDGADHDEGV
ncbi:MAG: ATP-dependent helicase [Actinobacteria bacterium]|nr:ATP-dependent helicase [Actinomycetota bacterium]